MTFAMPKEAGNLAEAYRWLPCTRCKDLSLGAGVRGEPRRTQSLTTNGLPPSKELQSE
jgi:hypothetical protein